MPMKLPPRTVERLSLYRRSLLIARANGKYYIYSHELANLNNLTAVQVRRDLMLMGYSSKSKKGYNVDELTERIGHMLESDEIINVAIVGMGNLGKAIASYFQGKRPKLNIVAAFDIDPNKTNRIIAGVKCYALDQMTEIVKQKNITVGIITVPPEQAHTIAEKLVIAGIKGILNFTSIPLTISPHVYLEEYDMLTSMEKVAYFIKESNPNALRESKV